MNLAHIYRTFSQFKLIWDLLDYVHSHQSVMLLVFTAFSNIIMHTFLYNLYQLIDKKKVHSVDPSQSKHIKNHNFISIIYRTILTVIPQS